MRSIAPALRLPPTRFPPTTRRRLGPCILRRQCSPELPPRLRVRSMATAENLSPVVSADDDPRFGFRRAEMYKSSLANTVDAYERHVFLCYKGPEAWAPRVEDSDTDQLPKLLSNAVKARKSDVTIKTKLTVIGGCDGIQCSDGDVLVFPDMVKYKGLAPSDVDSFVEDVFVKGKPWASGMTEIESLTGTHIFVCAHGSRDKRCGVCGPPLIEKLNDEIELRDLSDQIFVSPCSHIGGHKYAGNLIIYSQDKEGKVSGHWYGYVTPEDVAEVLDQHVLKGSVIERLWRGQMGASPEEHEQSDKPNLPNRKDEKIENILNHEPKETPVTCCQEATGVSCCQEGSSDQKTRKNETEVKGKPGKWEQREVLTAAAMLGAVAAVALAYTIYRRSA